MPILALAMLLLPVISFADERLVKEMEVEIAIQEIAKATAKMASETAWEAVKKTSLWKRRLEAGERAFAAIVAELEAQNAVLKVSLAAPITPATPAAKTLKKAQESLLTAKEKVQDLEKEAEALAHRFARKIYREEIKRQLEKLEVEITKDILKNIEKSYKLHSA